MFIFLFSSPLAALEIYLRQPSADEFSAKRTFLEENKTSCEVLLMGSSHTQTDLNPEWIDMNSVNVANFSQPFYYDYKILEKYAREMPVLKAVVLSLSYPVFYSAPTERQENLYSIHWGLEPYSGKKDIDNYSAVLALGLENSIDRAINGENYYQHRGWYESNDSYKGAETEAKNKAKVWHGMMYDEEWEGCVGWLDKIIAECKKNDIRLILYFPPFVQSLNDLIRQDHWSEKILVYSEKIKKEDNVIIIDTNDNEIYSDNFFKDPDHLNRNGAMILTKTINDVLNTSLSNN